MKIRNAILHSLNNSSCVLSDTELDINSETCSAFIIKHVKKLLNNPASKEATFNVTSEVYKQIIALKDGKRHFKDVCVQIGRRLSDVMKQSADIPEGDLLIVLFDNKRERYIAVIKLNYMECFTHQTTRGSAGADNQIVKYAAVLPFDTGKTEEACLIPFDPMVLKVIEKPFNINGESVNYFSELFLECDSSLSKKEAVQILNEISEEINEKYFDNSIDSVARIKTALLEQAEEARGEISIESVAGKAFGGNAEIRDDYIGLARDAGLRADMMLGEKFVRQQFGTQRIKAENGIELKFPAELWGDSSCIEMIRQTDGSNAILLKNLGQLEIR
ncbi:MAG: nucleoid-associated protein [Clostridiales bacterium]|jgi:predicted CopG family antitoxin|nr:nucleoid-associated protein [Clostridiales bacterium]